MARDSRRAQLTVKPAPKPKERLGVQPKSIMRVRWLSGGYVVNTVPSFITQVSFKTITPQLQSFNAECRTTPHDGDVDVNHQHCMFPFRYQGKIYSECTTDCTRCTETLGRPWCATRLDSALMRNAVDWALCQPGCPGVGLQGLSWAVGEDGLPALVFGVPDIGKLLHFSLQTIKIVVCRM